MALHEKVAVVTGGGGQGSGRAIARRFAALGATTIVADVNEQFAQKTALALVADGLRATHYVADVGCEADVQGLFRFAEERFGGVDLVVNNASALVFPETSFDDALANLRVDLLGAIHVARHAIDAMRRRGGGAVVNISSTSALAHGDPRTNSPGSCGYNTAKAAIVRFTTTLAGLGSLENIRVNCLVPHWIGTDHIRAEIERMSDEERRRWEVPDVLISPQEIAEVVVRLATDGRMSGRVLVWYGGSPPRLIPFADPGYATLEDLPPEN